MNPVRPDQLSALERLAEVADLLALGILSLRMETPSGEAVHRGEGSLDFMPRQSGGPKRGERAERMG